MDGPLEITEKLDITYLLDDTNEDLSILIPGNVFRWGYGFEDELYSPSDTLMQLISCKIMTDNNISEIKLDSHKYFYICVSIECVIEDISSSINKLVIHGFTQTKKLINRYYYEICLKKKYKNNVILTIYIHVPPRYLGEESDNENTDSDRTDDDETNSNEIDGDNQ
jgi:hypothetical protein